MMNVIQIQDRLKSFSEDQLAKEMESPSGSAPQYLVLSEFNRRKRVKADYEQQQNAQQQSSTVAEDVLAASGMPQAGLGALAQNMAPKTDMVQNSGAAPQQTMPMPEAPDAMAEIDPSEGGLAAMAGGGSVKRMAKGGRTQVEYDGRGYFVFDNGEVKDALSRPVSEYLAEAVKASMNKSPDATTSTQSLSPTMADESPEAPTLESVLSSDRPFNPLELSTPQARDATPPDYGLGGERPDTLTEATAPAINQQQALIDAMSPAFDEFGGDPLARAEERSNLSGPSISDVSPTVGLDLTTDQRISQEDMAMAQAVPQGQPRNFTQLLSDIKNPVERGRAILAQSQSDQATSDGPSKMEQMMQARSLAENQGGPMGEAAAALAAMEATPYNPMVSGDPRATMSEVMRGNLPMAEGSPKKSIPLPETVDEALMALEDRYKAAIDNAGSYDDLSRKDRMGFAAEYSMVNPDNVLVGDDRTPEEVAQVTESLLPPQAPSEPYVPFIPIEPRVGERSIGVGDTFSRAAAAREQGLNMPNPMPPTSTDLRGDPGQYGFPQADNIAMGESIAELDRQLKEIPSELSNVPTDLDLADVTSKALQEASFDMPSSLTQPIPSGTEANPIIMGNDPAGIEATRPKKRPEGLKPVLGDPKLPEPTTPTTPTVGSGGLESELAKMLAAGEKRRSTEKWLSLARAGAELMKGRPDGFSKAIEVGTKSLQDSQDNYSADKLKILTLQQRIAAGKSKGSGGLTANQSISRGMEYIKLADDTLLQATMLKDTNPNAAARLENQATQYRQMGRSLIGVPIGESGVTKMDTPSKGSN